MKNLLKGLFGQDNTQRKSVKEAIRKARNDIDMAFTRVEQGFRYKDGLSVSTLELPFKITSKEFNGTFNIGSGNIPVETYLLPYQGINENVYYTKMAPGSVVENHCHEQEKWLFLLSGELFETVSETVIKPLPSMPYSEQKPFYVGAYQEHGFRVTSGVPAIFLSLFRPPLGIVERIIY